MMIANWTRLAERRMLAAVAEGKLSHLEGEGKPLPRHDEQAFVDPGDAIGFRIMAEAGFLPQEVELGKKLVLLRAAYRAAANPADKKELMAKIADTSLRQDIAREARMHFLGHHH